jgi:hypothetical protein
MLLANTIRTFLCPHCGVVLTTGTASCDTCLAPIDKAAAEAAADRREQILKANGDGRNLVFYARVLLGALSLLVAPVPNLFRVATLVFLLVQVPLMSFRWYRYYGKLRYAEPELAEARRWWEESMLIWCLAVSVTALWTFLVLRGRR